MRPECTVLIKSFVFCEKPSVYSQPGCPCDYCDKAFGDHINPPHTSHYCAEHYDELMEYRNQCEEGKNHSERKPILLGYLSKPGSGLER